MYFKSRETKKKIRNWKPIIFLRLVYKLTSGCIAERIEGFLDILNHCDQTCFIKGRFIGKNIRLVHYIMHYTEIMQSLDSSC